MTVLPIAQYMPDAPDFPATGSANIRNVMPRTPASYGPIGKPMAVYGPLPLRCQGAAGYRDSAGGIYMFAGDATDLFEVKIALATWGNVSKAPAAYTVNPYDQWQFVYFNGDVIAVQFGNLPQFLTIASGTNFADLNGAPPQARYAAVVATSFVVLGNTYDAVNGNRPQRIWWSAAGDAHNWPTPGSAVAAQLQSGYVDLLGDGGWIQGIAPDLINANAVVIQEYAVKQMVYIGPPDIFAFLPVENALGCPAPYSIVVLGGTAYYLRQDGFCAFDGTNSIPIGANRVDKTFFANVGDIKRVVAAIDPVNRMIWWAYPTLAGDQADIPSEMLGYNWQLDRWTIADVSCETLVRVIGLGYTLDQLYTILGYSLDDLPAPLDSPIWQGGRLLFGLFDTSHTLNFMTGPNLAATVDTMEMQPFAGLRAFIGGGNGSRPLVDGTAVPTVSIGHRERQQDSVTYTRPIALNSMGACPVRTSGRYLRGRIVVPADQQWTNLSGIEIDAVQQGRR